MKKYFLKIIRWLSASENRKSGFYILFMMIILFIYSCNLFGEIFDYNENIVNVLSLLFVTYFLSDRLFAVPRNVLANAISVFVLALTMNIRFVAIYSFLVLIIGFLALVYKDGIKIRGEGINEKICNFSFKTARYLGNSKVIVSLLLFFTLRTYIITGKSKIVIWSLFLYWLILLIPNLMNEIFKLFKNTESQEVGIVAYANSPYNVTVHLKPDNYIGIGDKVCFNTECNDVSVK